jgi:hypothetical protein
MEIKHIELNNFMVGEPGTWWQRQQEKKCNCKKGTCKYGTCSVNVLDKILKLIKSLLK